MVKKINLNVTYNSNNKIISCQHHEFADKVSEHFKIDLKDVMIIAVNKGARHRIYLSDIKDLMKIELVPRKNTQRSVGAVLENDSSSFKLLMNITDKLRQNSQLTGQERKALLEGLEIHKQSFFKKRKLDEGDDVRPETSRAHKKLQVNVSAANLKDSFAQTDPVAIAEIEQNGEGDVTEKLKRIADNPAKKQEVASLMKASFQERRIFIVLHNSPVTIVKETYPTLFCLDEVKRELDRIFYPGKCKEFIKNLRKYSEIILETLPHDDDIRIRTNKCKDSAQTPTQKNYASMVGSVFGLTKLMEEEFGFIRLMDHPHGSADVYPYIDASCHSLKEIFFDCVLFHIIVEGQHLCEAPNFEEAMLCLIASFFIFNISYPVTCHRTLTVIEKVHLTANDTTEMDDNTAQMIKFLLMAGKK